LKVLEPKEERRLAGWMARRMENEDPTRPQWRAPYNGSQFEVVQNPWNLNCIPYLYCIAYTYDK